MERAVSTPPSLPSVGYAVFSCSICLGPLLIQDQMYPALERWCTAKVGINSGVLTRRRHASYSQAECSGGQQ
ncbi:hypothetical protein BO78DRAFT_246168 [Aspergillus sclerotiicarbonarius CBS 121057]|uniref:Uncharacterized protein n=1 Tax=Aspergillus sclerotiicarbonarius (strain CBS 121057 / IBT 28362) TaxID=1448318 RepID=A0A319DV61_ASPSB|nr:hypothetical protein BO78DRAFT_246168 [Aspergillus sclerotiicarbonarius CBS 121057]